MQPPIFIINMASSIERWHTTSSRLQAIGLEGTRFEATVGKALSEQEVASWYSAELNLKRHHRNMTPGEIGCYISHMRIWRKMRDENIPFCIVLEDDIKIEPHLVDVIEQIDKLSKWDLVKLSDNCANSFIDEVKLSDKYILGNYLKVPNCCNGYALSLDGAKKLLNRKPFFRPVDVDIQFHSEVSLNITGIKPYPIDEDLSFISDIASVNNGRHSNRSTFWRNFRHRKDMYFQRKKISADLSKITPK
ncbi:MAG: glycosyl transferase family 25 [Pseudoalteromonas sp.]|nr:glycosyl transferase family 25 [Pseudoalteromonas sp.]|tara:strand:- start:804 stop:1547 length:744 start_codon:yes stop_codon:yes gene_type:complete